MHEWKSLKMLSSNQISMNILPDLSFLLVTSLEGFAESRLWLDLETAFGGVV